jgi:hypothetical protein
MVTSSPSNSNNFKAQSAATQRIVYHEFLAVGHCWSKIRRGGLFQKRFCNRSRVLFSQMI